MKYEEAIELLRDMKFNAKSESDSIALGMAIEAMQRNVEVEPQWVDAERASTWFMCPVCGHDDNLDIYCAHCGQKLHWED